MSKMQKNIYNYFTWRFYNLSLQIQRDCILKQVNEAFFGTPQKINK